MLFFRVCGMRLNFYVFSLYSNPDLDNRIFDCLLTTIATVQAEDASKPLSCLLVIWMAIIGSGWVHRLLIVVDWCASWLVRLSCCRIILTASSPGSLFIRRSFAIYFLVLSPSPLIRLRSGFSWLIWTHMVALTHWVCCLVSEGGGRGNIPIGYVSLQSVLV